MSNYEQQILEGIKALGNTGEDSFIAAVEQNYPEKDHVDVRSLSGVLYTEVRKRAALKDDNAGIIITPGVGSTIIVTRIGKSDELFVSMFSDIESIVIDGGEHGGLTITPELVKELGKLTARVDGIIEAIKGGVPIAQDGGVALQQTIVAKLNTLTEKENFSKITNDKIKH